MKKFFYSMLLLAVAAVTAVSFASCSKDDDTDEMKVVAQDEYLCFQCWISSDVLEIADVVASNVGTLKFSTEVNYGSVSGRVCELVELTGKTAKERPFTVTLKLKPNWKELVSKKDVIHVGEAYFCKDTKTQGPIDFGKSVFKYDITRQRYGDKFEDTVAENILETMGYEKK